ncbi:WXG100 family type VII secretion target [Streptomyces platensis]|uniref:WXG100 family type VII secretion target n=1 Tax=Streptomyces platensis TaxID=58346 RepID=UPI003C2F7CED
MDFKVEPNHIAGFGKLVGRAADNMRSAMSYVDRNTAIGGSVSSFVWDAIGGSHEQTVTDAKATIKDFTEVLDASQRELTSSARYYRETDQREASKLDRTYRSPGSAANGTRVKPISARSTPATSAIPPRPPIT